MSLLTEKDGTPGALSRLVLPLIFIALVLGMPFGMATSPMIFRDGDVSWHIAAGRWMFEHMRVPYADPFSFTAFGKPWIDTEWLAEIFLAGSFDVFGYAGLAIVTAAALMAVNALIFMYLQRRVSPVAIAIALPAMVVVLSRFVLARPHTLAWVPLAAWTIVCLRASEKGGRAPSLWWVLILPLWSNMHASFPLALPIAGAIALDSMIEHKWRHFREWLFFGVASVAALMVNANGISGVLQPFNISALSILPFIGEWRSTSPTNSPFFFPMLMAGLFALLWSRPRIPVGRLLLLIVLLAMALAHVRHQSYFAIVAACILPTLWKSRPAEDKAPLWALAGAIPFLAIRAVMPLAPPMNEANPWHLIAQIPPELRSEPVFNEYSFGGPLILSGIKVFIDGRAEMYGDRYSANYVKIMNPDAEAFDRTVKRYGIEWFIMPWVERPFIRATEGSGKWCRIRQDEIGVIAVNRVGRYAYLCRL